MARPDPERFRKWGSLAGIGPLLVASVVAGLLLGRWIDQKIGTAPWLMVAGLLLGAVGGFVELFRIVADSSEGGRKRRPRGGERAEKKDGE